MINLILLTVIIAIISLAIYKIIKEKKAGVKCIGCPIEKRCNNSCNSHKIN